MSDNINSVFTQHGGNLSFIAQNFPDAPKPLIDLSTGINPYPYPLQLDMALAGRLADVAEMEEAHKAAATYYGVSHENITLAAGMQPLMFAIAAFHFRKHGATKVAILSPTYSEYEKIWKAAGHIVINVHKLEELAQGEVAIICNPNNPDGKIYSSGELAKLQNKLLIIDEAFADVIPLPNHPPEGEGIVKMRSCGKFFGIAGLRVSVAIASDEISEYLRLVMGDWAISTPVCKALPTMFADKDWIEKTKVKLNMESEIWRNILAKYFNIIGYTELFTLVEAEGADYYFIKLARAGILVRKFSYNNRWLRFGLPDKKNLERIEAALK